MQFGIVGLGRIGGSLARQGLEKGHRVVGYNRSPDATQKLASEGMQPTYSLGELASNIAPPRVILVYVPHGKPTDEVLHELKDHLERGDVAIDGGDSHWKESARHDGHGIMLIGKIDHPGLDERRLVLAGQFVLDPSAGFGDDLGNADRRPLAPMQQFADPILQLGIAHHIGLSD